MWIAVFPVICEQRVDGSAKDIDIGRCGCPFNIGLL